MTEQKEFILKGLNCANCAAKIEAQVKGLPGIINTSLDLVSCKLKVEVNSNPQINRMEDDIKEIVNRYEPHVVVSEQKKNHRREQVINDNRLKLKDMIPVVIGTVIFLAAVLMDLPKTIEILLYVSSYLLTGGDVVYKALKNIFRGQVFDENFLMTIATIGAFAIGEYPEAVAVMIFYQVGEAFQDAAVNRSRRSIQDLMNIRPDYANVKRGEEIHKVNPEDVEIGDIIIIQPGDRVPLDGKVLEGRSMADTSALTGESVPRMLKEGDEVLSGFINSTGLLAVKTTKKYGESTVARILDLVENAGSKKAPTENFITKFARYYTPIVVIIASLLALIPPLVIPGAVFSDWLYRALIFLVISCPCALVVSIPLGFFGGIGGASKNGILVKGGNFLEALNRVDSVVFDKTGTVTKGVFKVTAINPTAGFNDIDLMEYAALAESFSNHPIARSVMEFYGRDIPKERIKSYEELAGYGVKAVVEDNVILAGNKKLMDQQCIYFTASDSPGTAVHVAVDGMYAGYLVISDEIKADSKKAMEGLRALGVRKLIMLTGDKKDTAAFIARDLGLDEFHAELLPHEKVAEIEKIYQGKGKGSLVFVGDGINDAPVLARADVGVAMGALGSDAAIEAADVVIMTDEPAKLVTAMRIARRTRNIVWQNIIIALSVKGVVLALGAIGAATMWEAVFADVGVAVIAIINSMRALDMKLI